MGEKNKVIYKIDPSTMQIVEILDKVSDITSDVTIYRVLKGQNPTYKDGYIYRWNKDVKVSDDEKTILEDKITVNNRENRDKKKYWKAIDLLKSGEYSIIGVVRICNENGFKISEETVKRLKDTYCI